jgi:hypothetical protein
MKGKFKYLGLLASTTLALVAGLPGFASAQQATLYEIVENLDLVKLQTTGHRVSNWTAQGTADKDSAFCPGSLLPEGVTTCTITAFGTDDIDLATFTGTVWANVVAVANLDNTVDGPEGALFTGQITGDISFPPVQADLGKRKALMGPAVPLISVTNGKFFPDAVPTVRTSPPPVVPTTGEAARFDSTFRLPFAVGHTGGREKPEHGKKAYYLSDTGSLIALDRVDEFALGFALLRAEVYFK